MAYKSNSIPRFSVVLACTMGLSACMGGSGGSGGSSGTGATTPTTVAVSTSGGSTPTTTSFPIVAPATSAVRVNPVNDASFATLINGVRAGVGAQPLTYNAMLDQAAQGHANDMLARGYFDHVSPGGGKLEDRVQATGYAYRLIGENIAQGQQSEQELLTDWQASAGHKVNNEHPDFEEFGLGVAGSGADIRWVLVFGDPQ